VSMCARFQAAPKECHLRAVKRIMRYLVLTPYVLGILRVHTLSSMAIPMWIMLGAK
jgi:hypothetical protein